MFMARKNEVHLSVVLCVLAFATSSLAVDKVSFLEMANHAARQSRLVGSEAKPFYLKASFFEITDPDSDFKGEIEEYWISPQKWRRTVTTPKFSQTTIMNGDRISESDSGDYFPFWLRELVTAVVDPLPMFDEKSSEAKLFKGQIEKPMPGNNRNPCAQFQITSGVAP